LKEISLENKLKTVLFDVYVIIGIFILAILINVPGFIAEWPVTHDVFRYVHLLEYFTDAIEAGFYYPRWMPEVYGGYGYPTFVFYQPAVFYLATPFYLITGNPFIAYHISMIISIMAGGTGAYYLCKQFTKDNKFAILGALFYLITPYLYSNLYVRGDLSELLGMMLCPWPIYFLLKIKEHVTANRPISLLLGGAAISLAAIVYSHPFAGMLLYPTYIVSAIAIFDDKKKNKQIKFVFASIFAMVLGGFLCSPYWLPACLLRDEVNYNWILSNYYLYDRHFVFLPQFFLNNWGFGDSMPGPKDYMSFQLGLFHFILALTGMIIARKNRLILISGISYFICIFMMTSWSKWIWDITPFIRMLQFPWRILMLTAIFQTICFCGIAELKIRNPRNFYIITVIVLLLFVGWHYKQFSCQDWSDFDLLENNDPAFVLEKEKEAMDRTYHSFCNENEFLPKSSVKPLPPPRQNGPIVNFYGNTQNSRILSSPHIIKCSLNSNGNSLVRINQIFLPGWKVKVNGLPLEEKLIKDNLTPSGLMTIPLGVGYYEIEAWYDGPPWLIIRCFLTGMAFISFILFAVYEKKAIQRDKKDSP